MKYDVDILDRSFLTLQTCMLEVMKKKGGNDYETPHMNKDGMLSEERHGLALPIPAELLAETIALIEAAPPKPPSKEKKRRAGPSKERKGKKSSNTNQPEKEKEEQQQQQ